MGKTKSIWKFITTESEVEVWWARIVQPEDPPEFSLIGKAPDTPYFWRTVKRHLKKHDDDTWHEPATYTDGVWKAPWE